MNRRHFISAAAGVALAVAAGAAHAQEAKAAVDAAKAAGVVGEQPDGFLGFVKPSDDGGVRAAVAEINAGRAKLYREAAARNGVTPEAAGAAAYKQVVEGRLKPGEYFKRPDGSWAKK